MRLLTLDFENVNSLYGHWRIDFTHPDYVRNPLFAIIGPTGSGKSSLLDAISLGLYGQTPRMQTVGSGDESDIACPVLSKGEKLVRAQVCFEADGRVYLSRWQRRIGVRSGKLNPPEVELIALATPEANEGEVITTKLTEWREQIEALTHMTFATFLRSVLLSQGAFADFLKAKDDDRAALLEQITGTAIYTEVSRWVFEKAKYERHQREQIEARLGAITLLSDAERQQMESEVSQVTQAVQALKAQRTQIDAQWQWRRSLNQAERQYRTALTQSDGYRKEHLAYQTERERAQRARQALEPARLWDEVQTQTALTQTLSVAVTRLDDALKAAQASLSTLSGDAQTARQALDVAQTEEKAFEPLLERVVALDQAITLGRQKWEQASQQSAHHTQRLAQTEATLADLQRTLVAYQNERIELTKTYDVTRPIESTQACWLALEQWEKERGQCADARKRHSTVQADRERERTHYELAQQALPALRATYTQADEDVTQLTQDYDARFGKARLLEQLTRWLAARRQAQSEAHWLSLSRVDQALRDLENTWEREAPAPWWDASGRPSLVATRLALTRPLEEALASNPALAQRLEALRDLPAAQLEQEEDTSLLAWAQSEEEFAHTLEARRQARQTAEMALRQGEETLALAKTKYDHVQAQHTLLTERYEQSVSSEAQAKATLAQHAIALRLITPEQVFTPSDIRAALKALDAQMGALKVAKERLVELENLSVKVQTQWQAAQETKRVLEREGGEWQTLAEKARESLESLQQERHALFGSQDPKVHARQLKAKSNERSEAFQAILARQTEASQTVVELTTRSEEKRTQLSEQRHRETLSREQFAQALVATAIPSLEALQAMRLPLADIEALEAEALRREKALEASLVEVNVRQDTVEKLKAQALSTHTEDELTERLERLSETLETQVAQQHRLASRLESDTQERSKHLAAQQELARQRAKEADWQGLSSLIGSHDGKKFRTIAQKITFKVLLRETNQVMRTMTTRYSLAAAGVSGMGVDVIDHDMGSIVRTASNLSGGETFMVSLSMALALSRMGGQYLNVDTLFLDEGFGTLDEEALNKAIYALETLQRSSGKLIGIISHVKMIRERIVQQVQVKPIAGTGRSLLVGSGISRLD